VDKKEATVAIQTVIARYSYAPEYSEFRKQVVAVTSVVKNSELMLFSQ
jgi:hypothetical protein